MHARIPLLRLSRRLGVRLREQRGAVLVEFAVILPVLLLIVLGIIYFGRYEDYANQETQLAEQGVRWAALNQNPATSGSLNTYIQSQAQPELQGGSSDVTSPAAVWIYTPAACSTSCYAVGKPIRVCVVATVRFPSPIGAPTVTMAQTATMRIEVASSTTYTGTNTPYTSTNPTGTMPSQCTA